MEHDFQVGEEVNVVYTGYTVRAKVIDTEPTGVYGRLRGWVIVEQITDYENVPAGERPRYEAAVEFIARPGEPLPESPLERMARAAGFKL